MISEEKYISYKQNFTGQSFQWVKTPRPELLGKVVKCRDVQPLGNMIMAIFDDGSQIDATKLTSDMMMISQDSPALTMEEVKAIYGPRAPMIPKVNEPIKTPNVNSPVSENISPSQNTAPVQPKVEVKRSNMFEMFNSDSSVISLNVSAKLPDKKLLKMMYNSAEDKEKFLTELTEYVHGLINKQVVRDSINQMMNPGNPIKKEKPEPGSIKLTEINNDGSK